MNTRFERTSVCLVITCALFGGAFAVASPLAHGQERYAAEREWSRERVKEVIDELAPDPSVDAISVSADGRVIAFESEGQIHIVRDIDGGTAPRGIGDGSLLSIAPDGRHVALRRAAGKPAVCIVDVVSPETSVVAEYPLANDSSQLSLAWSPESRSVAIAEGVNAASGARTEEADPIVVRTSQTFPNALHAAVAYEGMYGQLWDRTGVVSKLVMLDTTTGKPEIIAERSGVLENLAWAPDGSFIAASLSGADVGVGMKPWPRLVTIDTRSHEVTVLPEGGLYSGVAISPSGLVIAALRVDSPGYYPRITLVSTRTGKWRDIHVDRALIDGGPLHWLSDHELIGAFRDGVGTSIQVVDINKAKVVAQEPVMTAVRAFPYATRERQVRLQSEPGVVARIVISDRGAEREIWARPMRSEFLRKATYHALYWKGADGETVEGVLILPPRSKELPPVIFSAYPGTATWSSMRNGSTEQDGLLLARGYAIFRINSRGPHVVFGTFAKGSRRRAEGSFGANGIKNLVGDIRGGVNALRRSGLVDTSRMCAYGHSNGGATVMQIITRASLFNCAVIKSPAFLEFQDAYYLMPGNLHRLVADLAGGRSPPEDPPLFDEMNPILRAGNVQGRVMILTGRQDIVAVLNSTKFFNAMYAAGKEAELVVYPAEEHVFGEAANADMWWRVISFFGQHARVE